MTPSTRRAIIDSHEQGYLAEGIHRHYPHVSLAEIREVIRVELLGRKRARERRRERLLRAVRSGMLR